MCSKHLYPLAPFAEQLETSCIIAVEGSRCTDIAMKRDKKHYYQWQMKILWISGGQRTKSMPPWRSRHLRPAMADGWLDCQHGGWAAFSSANVWPPVRVYGEKVRVLAGSVGESLWCEGVRRFGRGMLEGQGGINRGHKRTGVTGVALWGRAPDLDPMASLALLLPKQLAWNAGVQNEGWWTWGQRCGPSCLPCPVCQGPCFTAG